mmetsp:Transcript_15649/g.39363  ORF Transcript_15649/g.39363 Transcript_15649/m.39363 type:complete len:203 (+) Transcript_15649:1157-1765(+)
MNKMIVCYFQTLKVFIWNRIVTFNVELFNISSDALKGSFQSHLLEISSYVSVSITSDLEQVNIDIKLHVLGFDLENLMSSILIRHGDFKFAIETSGSSESGLDNVGAVGGCNNHHIRVAFQRIHQRQKLRDNTLFGFSLCFVTLGCDRVEFIHENDRRGIFGSLFESLAQVRLGLATLSCHNFRAVDYHNVSSGFFDQRVSN